jgi:ankyrin repeat protein
MFVRINNITKWQRFNCVLTTWLESKKFKNTYDKIQYYEVPIHLALKEKDILIVNKLIDTNVDVNTLDCQGYTVLDCLVGSCNTQEYNKRHCINNNKNWDYEAPETLQLFETLINNNAIISNSMITSLASGGDNVINYFKLLINKNINIHVTSTKYNYTPLHMVACSNNHSYELCKFLINNGADLTAKLHPSYNGKEMTPYEYALYFKHYDILSLLKPKRLNKE